MITVDVPEPPVVFETRGRTKTAKLLRAAAALITRYGHAHGEFQLDDGRMCVHGALFCAATGWEPRQGMGVRYLYQENNMVDALATLGEWLYRQGYLAGPIKWNDLNDRDTVVAGLLAAADDEDARHTP